jgi:hypothetical protein
MYVKIAFGGKGEDGAEGREFGNWSKGLIEVGTFNSGETLSNDACLVLLYAAVSAVFDMKDPFAAFQPRDNVVNVQVLPKYTFLLHRWQATLLCSEPTPTFSHTALSIYTPSYDTSDTWDCITVVSDLPNIVPAYPLDILPRVAPEPITMRSLMCSWPYTSHHFTEFHP